MPAKKLHVTWKQGKSNTGEVVLNTPVIALNLRMIDRRLKQAGLRELQTLVQADSAGDWLSVKEVLIAFESALAYFTEHPETLPFSDLVVKDLPVAAKAIRSLPKRSLLRLTIDT
jgi:hypothetical protein